MSPAASDAGGPAFLRCEGASPPAATRIRKTHTTHRRIKIEQVYRPYLTATEADNIFLLGLHRSTFFFFSGTERDQVYRFLAILDQSN
jgi:hypothetical protein